VTQDVVTGNYSVTFTFDSAVNAIVNDINFDLYDDDGTQFRATDTPGAYTLSNSNRSVTLTTVNSVLTNEQMAAAVVGAVQNDLDADGDVTEREVPVT
jgi:hypothetical protein